ncbi:MAG: T9SS type A sorting domain-containing protein [Ignavibacteria bacterium]
MRSSALLLFFLFFSNLYSQAYQVFDSTKQSVLENLIKRENGSDHYYRFNLSQNYPNPFNPSTVISYHLPSDENGVSKTRKVVLKIYDILGNEIKTLVNESKQEGDYQVTFDASDLPSGVYIYKLQSGEHSISKKMLLIK